MTETTTARVDTDGAPLEATTIPAAFQRVVATYPDKTALRTIDGSVELTWAELDVRARKVATGLAGLGVQHADSVAIILPNTIECHLVDFAASHVGAVPFAVFNSSPAEQIEHQLRNADARVVVTQVAFLEKVQAAVAALGGQVEHVVLVDGDGSEGLMTLAQLEESGDPALDLDAVWQAVTPDDVATLIYTSGTTGPPKGAQWSHRTVMSAQRAMDAGLPVPTENIISFLPMAHAGGRVTVQYMALAYGATITVCPDMTQVPKALVTVHPDAFFSVPRLWEKLQVAIEGMAAGEPDEERRAALLAAIEVGVRAVQAAESGSGASAEDLSALEAQHAEGIELLKPLLARLGLDRLKAAFVGGAPSAPELSQFFRAVGVPMLEAYGLTEGSLNVFNQVADFKSGTAGRPLPGVELRLAEDGEILVRSDLNFVGYRKEPEATAAALDADGWLHTGDIGTVDENGFVSIVDRKKEIIINASGKNMSPAQIESAIKGESSLIGQIVAIGDRRKYVTALITLDAEALPTYAARLGLEGRSLDELAASEEINAEVAAAVERGNEHLHGNEKVKKFRILSTAWLPDGDELTPTAKLKRRVIHVKYADDIEGLYAD
ncbi:AMP-dependent synthetase [Aeromicrobium sp. Root495]|uniref:AMP-dependent synthetase/ligase n=1 Tax=Aeromicrobium sp. Root495 TaxID=1736550 RepID=UPI0007016FD7|nr:long-chain fatty acid--CoA ligase [Aeromicrobium sp. Root495]KQY58256.1 AMP-dependent synthetase [Aeromicrobium sp. Root495]